MFIPTEESIPPLRNMSVLFLKEEERDGIFPWRAACIDLELDACGNTMEEAWESLKVSLTMYIKAEVKAADGSVIEAAKNITKTVFEDSDQKRLYFETYRKAKMEYTMRELESKKIIDPISFEKRKLEALETVKGRPIVYITEEEEPMAA